MRTRLGRSLAPTVRKLGLRSWNCDPLARLRAQAQMSILVPFFMICKGFVAVSKAFDFAGYDIAKNHVYGL